MIETPAAELEYFPCSFILSAFDVTHSFDGGILVLEELQRSGRARVNGTDFLNGERGVLHEVGFAN